MAAVPRPNLDALAKEKGGLPSSFHGRRTMESKPEKGQIPSFRERILDLTAPFSGDSDTEHTGDSEALS